MENQVGTEITDKNIRMMKEKLPIGSYQILSKKLNGEYRPRTIEAMFNCRRTMQPVVFEAAEEFIEMINPS